MEVVRVCDRLVRRIHRVKLTSYFFVLSLVVLSHGQAAAPHGPVAAQIIKQLQINVISTTQRVRILGRLVRVVGAPFRVAVGRESCTEVRADFRGVGTIEKFQHSTLHDFRNAVQHVEHHHMHWFCTEPMKVDIHILLHRSVQNGYSGSLGLRILIDDSFSLSLEEHTLKPVVDARRLEQLTCRGLTRTMKTRPDCLINIINTIPVDLLEPFLVWLGWL